MAEGKRKTLEWVKIMLGLYEDRPIRNEYANKPPKITQKGKGKGKGSRFV